MLLTRRTILAALAAARSHDLKIGAMDGVCGKRSDPASVAIAARNGIDGIQVTLGNLSDPEAYVRESKAHGIPLVATYIDILHTYCLKNDREALRRAADGIATTKALGAPILMLVFFGKCALSTRDEMDAVAGPLKELAAEAARAQITLGFENTIKAEDDLRILDQVGSDRLQIYYDIGNATNLYNVDPAAEIRQLRGRICQFHFKDRGYLGEGKVDVRSALEAIRTTGWKGYLVLETGSPAKNVEADLKRNRDYLARALNA